MPRHHRGLPDDAATGAGSSWGQGTNVNSFTLTMRWNGTAWSIVRSPDPATPSRVNGVQQTLNGTAARRPADRRVAGWVPWIEPA